jgi:hypothetical protein
MDEELPGSYLTTPASPTSPIFTFVVANRGSPNGRGHNSHGGRGGRGLPTKCSACGSLGHILSSCMASDDALVKWTLTKRKMIVHTYGNPSGNYAFVHAAHLSDVSNDDSHVHASHDMPTLEECTGEYNDIDVSVPSAPLRYHLQSPPVVTCLSYG